MDKVQEMTSFVAVVEAGSFVGAADATGQSKAAVSRHVGELEQRLGVRLMQRTTRRLSLTAEGQQFYARCKDVLAAIDEAEAEVSQHSGEPSGLVRINAPLSFGVLHLAPIWGHFAAQYPKVSLDIGLSDRLVDLVDEGYDLAVRITTLPSSNLVSRRLASTRLVLCAAPAYLAQHGIPTHPEQLAQHATIAYTYFATRDEWQFKGPTGDVRVRLRPVMHANNGDTCRAVALAGQGVILQPDFIVGDDLHSGALVELMPEYRALELGIHAVYPTRKYLPLKVRRLVDFLVEAFAQPAWQTLG